MTIQKKITLWPTGTAMRLRTIKDEGTIFRTVPPDSLQAYALAAAAVADKIGDPKGKLLSIAYRTSSAGEGLAKDLVAGWTAKGGKGAGTDRVRSGAGDLRPGSAAGRREQP